MRYLSPALLLIIAAVMPSWALAAAMTDKTNTYTVEILVFATKLPQLEGDELWTMDAKQIAVPQTDAAQPANMSTSAGIFPSTAADLVKDGRFRILAHQRWIQTIEAKSASLPVRIHAAHPKSPGELDGTLRIYLSRYLHMDINLVYQEDIREGGFLGVSAANPGKIAYRINEQRRIKGQETHYIDHPKFGALVRLTPVKGAR